MNEELAKRLVRDGHEVHFVVGGFSGCTAETMRDGFRISRVGGRVSVYWYAYRFYKKHLRGWPDKVIDEVNTVPFFARFYVDEPVWMFFHQLARQIWFYEMSFPLNLIGYVVEPIYLFSLRKVPVITVSQSTKQDLMRYGFVSDKIHIISEGIEMSPVSELDELKKENAPTILALGSIRAMKRTVDILRAFEIAKKQVPDLKLWIAGKAEGKYGASVLREIGQSVYKSDITYFGKISAQEKKTLLQKTHLLCVTSVKEGWGLVVTEANSQGTPAAVYDVDGLRDSVKNNETGTVCFMNPTALAMEIVRLVETPVLYQRLRECGWNWSKELTFEKSYQDFQSYIL